MVNSLLNNQIRQYLLKIGLDFSNYGSMFIKTGLIYMIEQCDIIYSKEIYKKLSIEYNKEIETIKKGIRISINDAL